MLKKGLGVILGILVIILGAVCWMKLRTPEEGQKVDNYRVIFEKGSYCGGTRTGCMDLKISLENGEHRKMFASADDVTGNGYHTITDDHYLLRVCLDDQELNSTAYEISADLGTQLLRIYFTNPQAVASTNQELPDVRIYATEIPDWEAVDTLTLTSGSAGSLILVRKDQMEDLTYVSGAVQSQEADTLFVAGSDGCFYKAPVPEDLQDTSFTLGQSVDIFYQEKTPQPYGYDLRGVTAISTFIL